MGIRWPEDRFSVSGDCVVDNLTGLMWMKNPPSGKYSWQNALSYAINLNTANLCGYNSGWRLPNILELESLVNLGEAGSETWLNLPENGFIGIVGNQYWSSTTVNSEKNMAWVVNFSDNSRDIESKTLSFLHILPVRGESTTPAQLWKTGQTGCYDETGNSISCIGTGQDGEFTAGAQWPSPRFTNPANGLIKDNLTGLIWTANANTPGPEPAKTCFSGVAKISYYAYEYIECLNNNNYLGYSDWRLPNNKELLSLIDHSQSNPALPPNNFSLPDFRFYWTSDTYLSLYSSGWIVDMNTGLTIDANKNNNYVMVWPVRGPLSLKVLLAGEGTGIIGGDQVSCTGSRCIGVFNNGDTITIRAEASEESLFNGWTGCPSPSGNECTIFMNEDITITATFLATKSIWGKPGSVNFGKVGFNVSSENKYVVVKNTNETNLQVKTVSLAGPNSGEYALDENCSGVTIPPGEACTILLSINAQDYGTRQAELVVTFNDEKVPVVKIKLKAKAVPAKIYVKPRSLNFRKVSTTGSSPQQITIQNTGVTPLSILSFENTGDNGGDFTIDPSGCPVLQEGQSCLITVTFAPGGVGKRSGTLAITSDAPKKGLVNVKLKGEGI